MTELLMADCRQRTGPFGSENQVYNDQSFNVDVNELIFPVSLLCPTDPHKISMLLAHFLRASNP